jgi:hypothetical protein
VSASDGADLRGPAERPENSDLGRWGRVTSMLLLAVAMVLAGWVTTTVWRIESLNAEAGYYLPRRDIGPDGSLLDGKWRVSLQHTPRDRLREMIHAIGLWQYLLAPAGTMLSLWVAGRGATKGIRVGGWVCGALAFWSWGMAIYRGYWTSLGT